MSHPRRQQDGTVAAAQATDIKRILYEGVCIAAVRHRSSHPIQIRSRSDPDGSCWLLLCRTGAAALCRLRVAAPRPSSEDSSNPSLFYNDLKNQTEPQSRNEGLALQKKRKRKRFGTLGWRSRSERVGAGQQPSLFGHHGYERPPTGL